MYKVLIIDDDALMLKYLRQLIDWNALGFSSLLESYSSVKALELFKQEKPDIVVTDIGLPQMNGLQLADQFKRLKPDVRIVFLTCYEEFEFVKQALHMNADDYLIKDKLVAAQLEQTLNKSIAAMKQQAVSEATESYQEDFIRNLDVLKSAFFEQLASGVSNEEAMVRYARRLGIKWTYSSFKLALGFIPYSSLRMRYAHKDIELLRYSVYNMASEISSRYEGISTFKYKGYLMVLLNYRSSVTTTPQSYLQSYLIDVQRHVEQFLKVDLHFINCTAELALKDIPDMYKKINSNRHQVFYEGASLIEWRPDRNRLVFYPANNSFETFKKSLDRAVQDGDVVAVQERLAAMKVEASDKRFQPLDWIQACTELVRSLEMKLNIRTKDDAFYQALESVMNGDDLVSLMGGKLDELIAGDKIPLQSPLQELKLQAIDRYIVDNLSENISSIDMAQFLELNPSYFSRFFKRLTGINFTDYAHRYKVGIAEQLLKNSDESVEIVAAKLGYYERSYFSKVFKKYTGLTPTELRGKSE
ncbi:response regulator [Bacillus sp. FJAT-26390]|uniref:response regulator transcription factor n=1 Tax=Bacillus sp. FJAT-26390 TaxID=1743142 RepID=UPI000807B240|nr:response regulator [Bacillus sp. FJAT-26390]OBZ13215.1 hypothetical protein A7975_10105 [Bacillus sp. FJAT-26390]